MKVWKRNAVVAAIVLFVCVAVYLNWTYQQDEGAGAGKTLGQATMVNGQTSDPLLAVQPTADPQATPSPSGASPAPAVTDAPTAETGTGYFASARLNRQQARDSALAILQESLSDENLNDTMKDENNQAIQTLANVTVSEAQIENLVTAKGYSDCVAFIGEKSVSVVVAAAEEGLTDVDVARITEIVTDETGFTAGQIKIIPAQP